VHRSVRRILCVLPIALTVLAASQAVSFGGAGAAGGSGTASPAAVATAKLVNHQQLNPISINYKPGQLKGNPAGKKVIMVTNQTGGGQESAQAAQQAAKILGINFQVLSVGNSATDLSNAFNQIVAQDSTLDGLMVNAFDPSKWQSQFNQLVAAHIPIVLDATDCDPSWNKYVVEIESQCSGVAQASSRPADYIMATSNGKPGNVVSFTSPGLGILVTASNAFASHFHKLCPSCSLDTQPEALSSIGTTLPGAVVSYLQAHPSVKYVFMTFGDMMIGVPSGVQAAGLHGIQFTTQSAAPTDVTYVKAGQEAAVSAYPLDFIYYVSVDAMARLMLKNSVIAARHWIYPTQLMTIQNVNTFPPTGYATTPGLVHYFTKLWNK
jgi:ABC-type sugar transport system substrate-binding protein